MKWLTLALTFTLAGCNTLSGRWEQKLLVRTTNSQDQIIEGESTLLPQGPQVTSVRRRRRGQIKIQKQDGSVEAYPLSGHYAAWWENLFFLHLTPAAWVTDWLTGAGYEYEGEGVLLTSPEKREPFRGGLSEGRSSTLVVVIAPPLALDEKLSAVAAQRVEAFIAKQYPQAKVFRYEETKEIFHNQGYFFNHQWSVKRRNRVKKALPADWIVETRVRGDGRLQDEVLVESVVKVFSTDSVVAAFSWPMKLEKDFLYAKQQWWKDLFLFRPNTVSLDLVSTNPVLEVQPGGKEFTARNEENGDLAKVVNVLGALGVSYWEPRRSSKPWRWGMNFVPAFALSYGKLVFEKLTGVEDIKFRRFLLSAGYGLRNMLSSYYGLFYFDIVPTLNYTRLGWEGKDVRGDGDAIKMNFISEIGYKYYFFRRWSLRFFVKSVTENRELWQRALDESATKTIVLRGARSTYAGFSLEYFFDDYK